MSGLRDDGSGVVAQNIPRPSKPQRQQQQQRNVLFLNNAVERHDLQ